MILVFSTNLIRFGISASGVVTNDFRFGFARLGISEIPEEPAFETPVFATLSVGLPSPLSFQ
jgi:hypothetical protein